MSKRLWLTLCLSVMILGVGSHTAWAGSSEDINSLKSEIEALKQGQKSMQKDLRDIKAALKSLVSRKGRAQQPFKPADITIDGSPVMGKADAPVTMVEFTDYQCPFCRRYSNGTFPQIIKDYVKTGKVRYVVRQFPLKAIHPKAVKASEASLCAGDQGKYWEMHDMIFKKTKAFNQEEWVRHAEALSLDMSSFKDCLKNGKNAEKVNRDLKEGMALGMRGTPGFFFGRTDPNNPNKFKAVQMIRGAHPYPQFKKIIEKLLKPS
jgi:protein-disulfide isomerase